MIGLSAGLNPKLVRDILSLAVIAPLADFARR
jgi:hypothetical protein